MNDKAFERAYQQRRACTSPRALSSVESAIGSILTSNSKDNRQTTRLGNPFIRAIYENAIINRCYYGRIDDPWPTSAVSMYYDINPVNLIALLTWSAVRGGEPYYGRMWLNLYCASRAEDAVENNIMELVLTEQLFIMLFCAPSYGGLFPSLVTQQSLHFHCHVFVCALVSGSRWLGCSYYFARLRAKCTAV